MKRVLAAAELILIFPAALFMAALFMRNVQPRQLEPAHSAQRLVEWFSTHPPIGLHFFLMAMPFAAFVIGCGTVLASWESDAALRQAISGTLAAVRPHLAILVITVATVMAGGILAIVALHALTD